MRLLVILAAALISACTVQQPRATTAFYPERITALEELLKQQRFDSLLYTLTPDKFKPHTVVLFNPNLNTDLVWLRTRAEQGYPPLLYVLAYRTLPTDPERAMNLYARARTVAFLDAKECRSDPRYPWYTVLETTFPELQKARTKHPIAYLKSVEEALRMDEERSDRPSANWYCEATIKDNMLAPEEAAAARKAKSKELREANQRKLLAGKDE